MKNFKICLSRFHEESLNDLIMMVEDNYSKHIDEDDCLIVGLVQKELSKK